MMRAGAGAQFLHAGTRVSLLRSGCASCAGGSREEQAPRRLSGIACGLFANSVLERSWGGEERSQERLMWLEL